MGEEEDSLEEEQLENLKEQLIDSGNIYGDFDKRNRGKDLQITFKVGFEEEEFEKKDHVKFTRKKKSRRQLIQQSKLKKQKKKRQKRE